MNALNRTLRKWPAAFGRRNIALLVLAALLPGGTIIVPMLLWFTRRSG